MEEALIWLMYAAGWYLIAMIALPILVVVGAVILAWLVE